LSCFEQSLSRRIQAPQQEAVVDQIGRRCTRVERREKEREAKLARDRQGERMAQIVCHAKTTGAARVAGAASTRRRANRSVSVRASKLGQGAKAGETQGLKRRDSVVLGLVAGVLAVARPARAGLFGGISEDVYANDTTQVLEILKATVELTSDSTNKEAVVDSVRTESNKWVAKYRRQSNFQGRPSYGNTYSAINAVLGHYNNFSASTLFPKRRLERVVKEIDDAGRALSRGR